LASLFMTVLDALTPSLRALIADALDEPPEAVVRGVRSLAGGLVGALKGLSSTTGGVSRVLEAVRGMDVGLLFDASPLLDTDWRGGEGLQPSLLGGGARTLTDSAAAHSGLRPDSGRALLRLVEPLVLAAIARSGVASDEAGLRSFLRSVEPEATRWAPPDSGSNAAAGATAAQTAFSPPSEGAPKRTGVRPTPLLLLALVVIALLLLVVVGLS